MTEQSSTTGARRTFNLAALFPQRSAGLKLLLVCALAALMTIPAMLIHTIVFERSTGLDRAIAQVSETAGGQQSVLGPVLTVPYLHLPDPGKPNERVYGIAIAFAETGTAAAQVDVLEKRRGIHTIPVYEANIEMNARFSRTTLTDALPENAEPIWPDARIFVGLSDTRGIKEAVEVTINNRAIPMEPAVRSRNRDGYSSVPIAGVKLAGGRVDNLATTKTPLEVTVRLRVGGAQRLAFGPFAKDTTLHMQSNWGSPSFVGGGLPDHHNVGETDTGFEATWRVPYMARGIPGSGRNIDLSEITALNQHDMGVQFIKEVSPYQSIERALKYAAMFIGFVFLAYFIFETTSHKRAHPAQYILVGLAQAIFYMLLLAFSERVGFDIAFLIAATMTVLMTSLYAMNVFQARKYGLRAFGILGGIYALIYVLMRAESQALLAGALASFAAIALTMYMTRNVDWYGDSKREHAVA
ncbi:MAG: cell envelope integrity protein CreD [Pseudomonadota bacterium]